MRSDFSFKNGIAITIIRVRGAVSVTRKQVRVAPWNGSYWTSRREASNVFCVVAFVPVPRSLGRRCAGLGNGNYLDKFSKQRRHP